MKGGTQILNTEMQKLEKNVSIYLFIYFYTI